MYLGIEIGGTKLQLGIGPGDGDLHALWRGNVVPADGADGIRRQIELAIPELLASAKRKREALKGVGIGFGGPVDDATRSVIKSHQIQGWDGFPLANWIEEMLGLPAVLGNDADVAGLAEALSAPARDCRRSSTSPSAPASAAASSSMAKSTEDVVAGRRRLGIYAYW